MSWENGNDKEKKLSYAHEKVKPQVNSVCQIS